MRTIATTTMAMSSRASTGMATPRMMGRVSVEELSVSGEERRETAVTVTFVRESDNQTLPANSSISKS